MKILLHRIRSWVFALGLLLGLAAPARAQIDVAGLTQLINAGNTVGAFQSLMNSSLGSIRVITLAEAQLLFNAANSGNYAELERLIQQIYGFNLGAQGSAAAVSSNQITIDTIKTSIFQQIAPASVKKAAAAQAAPSPTRFGADAFYDWTELDGGAKIKTYGTNLSLATGDQFQFKGTAPIYHSSGGGVSSTTYGIDFNGRYKLSEAFAIGAHANHLRVNGSGADSHVTTGGAYFGAAAPFQGGLFSYGALLDYQKPKGGDAYWSGNVGVNVGFEVSQTTTINPYVIYYRRLSKASGDRDAFDVGGELQIALNPTWVVKLGAKTLLGRDGVDKSFQGYLGSSWSF